MHYIMLEHQYHTCVNKRQMLIELERSKKIIKGKAVFYKRIMCFNIHFLSDRISHLRVLI